MLLQASKRLRKFFNTDLTDKAIWQEIIDDGNLNNIHQLTRLNSDAAQALVKREKRMQLLSLGIAELPPEVAAELVKYNGEKMYLNLIKFLSPESAKILSNFTGVKLMLNGVKTINLTILGRLSAFKGALHLDGVNDFEIAETDTRRAETVFANLAFSKLSMSEMKKPPLSFFKAISRFRGYVELGGIESLAANEVDILTTSMCSGFALKGIKTLTVAMEKLFSHYKGYIDMSGAIEIDQELLLKVAIRPDHFMLLSAAVKNRVAEYRKKMTQEELRFIREKTKEEHLKDEALLKDNLLLKEFEDFDRFPAATPGPPPPPPADEYDPYTAEINEDVLEDIEINLNLKISQKRRHLDTILKKDMSALSEEEKKEVQSLRSEIKDLNDQIRSALDILVERKELGAVIFNNTNDLISYLVETGTQNGENDALSDIENDNKDIFGNCFLDNSVAIEVEEEEEELGLDFVEGDDFAFTPVTDPA